MIGTLDYETTTKHKGNPYVPENYIVSAHRKVKAEPTRCSFHDEPDFRTCLQSFLDECTLLVGVNLKFDLAWSYRIGLVLNPKTRIWDCMLAEFILSGQTNSFASLNQLAEKYGLGQKDDEVASYWEKGVDTPDIPRDVIERYGNRDVDLSYAVYLAQLNDPRMTPELHKLIILDGLDLLVLLEMEFNGFKYDKEKSLTRAEEYKKEINEIEKELNSIANQPINYDSGDQLSCFLYGGSYSEDVFATVTKVYKSGPRKGEEYLRNEFQHTNTYTFPGYFKPLSGTELKKSTELTKFYSTAEDTLLQLKGKTKVQQRIITLLRRRSELTKLVGTYLEALPKLLETMNWGEYIHGQFNQVIARTGRLSSSKPNLQNNPAAVDEFFVSRYE